MKSDPEIFRERAGLGEDVLILGPYKGSLRNEGEEVLLTRPISNGVDGESTYVAVDRVVYDDVEPWSFLAAGAGSSIERRDSRGYGNDPANWVASRAGGTPGNANVGVDEARSACAR